MEEIDSNLQNDIKDDYNFARDNLYDVIEKGNEALEDLIQVAKASEHPRAYEVVAQLIKTLNDSNQNLMDVQKKLKDLNKNQSEGPKNVTNALFVGSTAELQKMIKEQK